MENALLIGLSKQMALQRQMDVIANNLANVATSGYKSETLTFEEVLMPVANIDGVTGSAGKLSYVLDARTVRRFDEGSISQTGNPLDVAINGKGWLVVQTAQGERYTRNGNFTLDANGQVVNGNGQPILGESGPITIGLEDTDLTIASDGTVSTAQGKKGKLRVVAFENENVLKKQGDNLFSATRPPQPAEGYRIAQGVIERSNVEPVLEIAKMIDVTRSYVSTARLLDQTAKLKSRAIEELGRMPTA